MVQVTALHKVATDLKKTMRMKLGVLSRQYNKV